jgi:hypothetical protein
MSAFARSRGLTNRRGSDRDARAIPPGRAFDARPSLEKGTDIAMNQSKINKVSLAQLLSRLIAGVKLHSSSAPIVLDGQSYTSQSLIDLFQSLVDALTKVDAAKAQWNDTLQQMVGLKAEVIPVVGAFRSYLLTTNGSSPSVLGDYGLSPKKQKTPLTGEQRAAATAKARATRAARHTMGPKQKAGVKGDVTGVVVMPVTTPAAPAVAPAPVVGPTPAATPASPTPASPAATQAPATANGR